MTRIACIGVLLCLACQGTVEPAAVETPDGGSCIPATSCGSGQNCGSVPDGCGGSVSCGSCGSGQTCGGGGTANVCGTGSCTPTTCAAQGKDCGTISDGCSSVLPCGTCGPGESCGAGGTPNVCAPTPCTPTTCAAQGKNCGTISDGCGAMLSCGSCGSGQTCGGGGTPNVCGGSTCTPTTCAAQGKNCGAIGDGCGGTLQCGSCSGSDTCGGGGTMNVCGSGSGIDQSILPAPFQTLWDPGIPGGIPADNDPVHPASVWLPAGNPYAGYSVNPGLTGQSNAAQFTSAFQAAINSAGAVATSSMRRIVKLKAGSYFVNPQQLPNAGGQVGISSARTTSPSAAREQATPSSSPTAPSPTTGR